MSLNRLNRSYLARWWWTVDRGIFIALAILALIGAVVVTAASPSVALRIDKNSYHFVIRQIPFLIAALGVIFALSNLSVISVRRAAALGLAISLIMTILTLLVGIENKGASRWLGVMGQTVQPSEFLKPFFAVVTGWFLARGIIHPGFKSYRIVAAIYLSIAAVLALQPDFGMLVTITLVWMSQMFVAGLPFLWICILAVGGIAGLGLAYTFHPHVEKRINNFFNPQGGGDTYQVDKSLEAYQNGGLLGVGPGEGTVKRFIPDAHTDFVFPVIAEEFGVIACIIVLSLFAFVVFRGLRAAMRSKDVFVLIASTGLVVQFGIQVLINVGVSLHILPTKGMTLPFLSYGGSSAIATALGMGMLLALTRKRYGSENGI
jgi:cell division protein FtsW